MNNLSKLGRFNRRVFCAACIFILSLSKKQSAHELKTIKANWCWLGAVTSNRVIIKARKQWGVLHFTDDGKKIEVKVELKKKNETKIEAIFTF